MTDAINYFQSIFMFKTFTPNSRAEVELAISLKNEARTLAAKASEEMHNGQTTKELALTATDSEKARIFSEITIWHNSRAAEKYGKAAERFAEAGKIHIVKRQALNLMAKKAMRRAARATEAVKRMNDFLQTIK